MDRYSAFVISQADGRPMYRQIMEHIKERVAVEDWPPGHALPSIRELAVDLQVSVITVKRAYQELERDGVILTRHGLGSFVAARADEASDLQRAELDRLLERSLALGRRLGMRPEALSQRLLALAGAPGTTTENQP